MTDNAKKQAGPVDSLSRKEKKANKKRTNKARRQKAIEHPEDLHQYRFNPYW